MKETMKLALEALEKADRHCPVNTEAEVFVRLSIIALREALAEQPAQQEPVAFLVDGDLYYPEEIDWETLQEQGHTVAPLYTSPPAQRTWVGLSDLNIDELENNYMKSAQTAHEFLRAIEAKLKEKNND